jgi:hypothetical protein
MAEVEFLRHLNDALPEEIPGWYYMMAVKEPLAHQALAGRPRRGRLVLPAERDAWAAEQAELLISGLRASGYDIAGDLEELRPRPVSGPRLSPSAEPPEQVLDAAVQACAALVTAQFRRAYPAARPAGAGQPRGLVSRVESTVAGSPRVKNTVRELSRRYPAMRKLRVMAWRELERRRAREGH